MAKIPLRAYLKDVENLIERGEIEQAIAHAKNILRAYPKHIETYRLLGKAFLESQRYGEAADILQRVLSVIPDDFVSQLGMSIIREDEGNLDAAIWHMERAYEVQPFNPAVQDELRRLYGKRDGIEPPKIRLTRGALVRMYARGELYPQAIAETRAALAEDAQRLDLRVLLARLYYQSGQKNDAAEVCSELIGKLPYCYEANRLLTEILPTTSRADETPKFQQRIYALDPYEAFVSPSAPTSQQVPDQAVLVEQYLWEPETEGVAQTPEWTQNVGVAWEETEAEVLPDWLNTLTPGGSHPVQSSASENVAESTPTENSFGKEGSMPTGDDRQEQGSLLDESLSSDDLVPDWMKEAGWAASDRSAEEIMAEQADSEEEALPTAEIPDWLQSIAPPEAGQPAEAEQERNDWLENILDKPDTDNGKETILSFPPAVEGIDSEASAVVDADSADSAESEDIPDWMAGLDTGLPGAEEKDLDALPDWLSELGTSQAQDSVEDSQSILTPVEALPESSTVADVNADQQPADEADMPAWLQSLEVEDGQPESPSEWLESLAEEPDSAASDETVSAVAEPGETLPEWGAEELPAAEEGHVLSSEDAVEAPEKAHSSDTGMPPMPDMSDTEATMAWLEMLAARQGADEAELVTAPEQRTETPPDWLRELEAGSSEEPVEAEAEAAAPQPAATPESAETEQGPPLPDWLAEAANETSADEMTLVDTISTETVETEPTPGEMEQAEETLDDTSVPAPPAEMPDLADEAAAMAWLESLAARQGADEAELITTPEERSNILPDWVSNQLESEEPTQPIEVAKHATEAAAESALLEEEEAVAADLPDWLRAEAQETAMEQPAETKAEVDQAAESNVEAVIEPTEEESAQEFAQETVTSEEPTMEAQTGAAAMPDLSDMDAAMAWLESLAARQGADEAELTTTPEERSDTPPDWVQKMEAEELSAQNAADLQQDIEVPQAEQTVPSWLDETAAPDDESGLPFGAESDSQSWMESETPSSEEIAFVGDEASADQPNTGEVDEESPAEIEAPSWLQDLAEIESGEQAEAETPEWLIGLSETSQDTEETSQWAVEAPATSEVETLPDWLSPTQADDQPAEHAGELEPMPDWLSGLEEEAGLAEAEVSTPGDYSTAWEPEIAAEVVSGQPSEIPESLAAVQAALNRGELESALQVYNSLIEADQHLDAIILDLREVLYRYPVDFDIWQTLGDAYARNNQLQEALDAYTKAEDLLR